jgi:hypothetical protein
MHAGQPHSMPQFERSFSFLNWAVFPTYAIVTSAPAGMSWAARTIITLPMLLRFALGREL